MKKATYLILIVSFLGIAHSLIAYADNSTENYIEDNQATTSETSEVDETQPTEQPPIETESPNLIKQPEANTKNDLPTNSLFGVTGTSARYITGDTSYSTVEYVTGNYNLTLKKDDTDPIVISNVLLQSSGVSTDFFLRLVYTPNVTLQALPEIVAPSTANYTITYSTDAINYDPTPPVDVTQIKSIWVTVDKLNASEKIELKSTISANWNNMNPTGKNTAIEYYENNIASPRVTFFLNSYRVVQVNYVDEQGNVLADPETLYGFLGNQYTATQLDIPDYRLKEIKGNPTGKFTDSVQQVTYVYKKIEPQPVTVKYVDENGEEIAKADILNGKIGESYNTTAKQISGWQIKTLPNNPSGLFTEDPQDVIYVYERIDAQPVTVKYVDEKGDELATPDVLNGKVGLPYETTAKQIDGWKVKTEPENASGIFSEKTQEVVYVYERMDAQPVTIKYVDENGTELVKSDILNGKVGLPYETTAKQIDGWQIKTEPKNASGLFSEKTQEVIYIYERIDAQPITVKYVDETGKELADSDILNGKVGLPYQTTAKQIDGWKVKTEPENAAGLFSEKEQEVTYVYERIDAQPITVKYVDEKGKELAKSDVLNGKVGLPYETSAKQIDGWKVKTLPENAAGLFSETKQEVIYVYERIDAQPITVKYVDEAGKELATPDVLNGKVGLPYQTTAKQIDGWKVKTEPENAAGLFSEKEQEVIYVYERIDAQPITVKYVDEAGKELATPDVLNGKVGLPYQTTAKQIDGWKVKTVPENATGLFSEKEQEVIYVYERIDAQPITVKYVDENGKELATSDVLNGKVGLPYETAAKQINGWKIKTEPENAAGLFSETKQEVIYVYERIDAQPITVKYVDETGAELAKSDVLNGKVGLPYETSAKQIDGWKVKTEPENAAGLFSETKQEVVYVYERIDAQPITVKYLDENGKELATPDVLNGKVGLPYQTTAKQIDGWKIKTEPENAAGLFSETKQEVIYVYERIDAQPITVKYVDETGKELADSDILNGKVGLPYETSAKQIDGWKVKTVPENAAGLFSETRQEVIYIYERIDAKPVTVKYVDENGTELATPNVLNGKVGLPYETAAKQINGWIVKTEPKNAAGLFSEEAQEVIYVYERMEAQSVTVKYIDENGNEIAKSDVLKGKVGLPYETKAKQISGWKIKTEPVNAAGLFSEEAQEVIYVYERIDAQPITVKYVDENGKELADSDILNGKVGLPYETKAKQIDGWKVITPPKNANGLFSEETQEVIYVYERVDAQPVTVKYVDENGKEIAKSDILNGKVGLPYETKAKQIDGWTIKVKPENVSGLFSEEAQEVIYVYERIDAQPITVKYLDKNGNEIADPDILNGKVGLTYETKAKQIDGWKVTTIPKNTTGLFSEEAQEVIYVYERVDAQPVTVKYLDENGAEIAVSDVLNGKVGLPYETKVKQIDGWTIKIRPENANGIFSEEAQTVIYVYAKEEHHAPSTDDPSNAENSLDSSTETQATVDNDKRKPQALPNTGESNTTLLRLGFATILMASSSYFFFKSKKSRNNSFR